MNAATQRRLRAAIRIDLMTIKLAYWQERALEAEAKVNDLYNRLDEMSAEIERLKLRIEQYEYNDREDRLYGS